MLKRMFFLYCLMIGCASVLFFRIYYLTAGDYLSTAAKTQSSYTLDVVNERGMIYDCFFSPLTNQEERYVAAVMPCEESLSALSRVLSGDRRATMIEQFSNNRPFLIALDSPDVYSYGVDVFTATRRYSEQQLAPHIVGHLQDGGGAYGIERAYDEILKTCGSKASISYTVDAKGTSLPLAPPQVNRADSAQGVVLTLDSGIQKIAEEIAPYYMQKGAVVVMDVQTGDIKASVSLPRFDPNNLSAAIENEDSPFVNRAFAAFSMGSTFKIVMSARALESGISENMGYNCTGAIEINGVKFGCHKLDGHGYLTMQRAMEQSCNPYFIDLGQRLEPARLLSLCQAIGLSRQTKLAPTILSAPGTLSTAQALQNRAEMANFSFGQGTITATPLQVAQVLSCIANGGKAVTPRLVEGSTEDGKTLSQENPVAASAQVIVPQTAQVLRRMLIATVEEGSGTNARPSFGSAGGKTSSAQTGIFNERGQETVHAWFSGFYPAKNPRYAIVVLNEGGNSGGKVAAPVFREIANGIAALGR